MSATLADDSALPSWLSFDDDSQTFTGTPTNSDVGNLEIKVTATDNSGESVFDIFNLTVANVNDAPTLDQAIVDQTATEGQAFSFTIPATTFTDIDGDSLSYTLAEGSPLPSGITFNAVTRTFSGTPSSTAAGTYRLKSGGGNDLLIGSNQRDILKGGIGNDRLYGEGDVDKLYGEKGDDILDGGTGLDFLYGGSGTDPFVLAVGNGGEAPASLI